MSNSGKAASGKDSVIGVPERIVEEGLEPAPVDILPTVDEDGAVGGRELEQRELDVGNPPVNNGIRPKRTMNVSATLDRIEVQTPEENQVAHMMIEEVRRHRRESRSLREEMHAMEEEMRNQAEKYNALWQEKCRLEFGLSF